MSKLEIAVRREPDRRSGYLAEIIVSDERVIALGGTSRDVTLLRSSDAKHFARTDAPGRGLRGGLVDDGALWVVGEYQLAARERDGAFATTDSVGGCLFGIAKVGDRLVAVGDGGMVLEVSEGAFKKIDLEDAPGERLNAIVNVDDEVFLLGFKGGLFALEEQRARELMRAERAHTALCKSPVSGTLLISGDGGQIYRREGADFERVESGTGTDLESCVCLKDGRFVVVGGRGLILVSDDDGRTFTAIESGRQETLWCATPFGAGALVGGDSGLILDVLPEGAEDPFADREDVFGGPRALDEIFAPGPDGFLDGELSRARRYVCAVNELELAPGALGDAGEYPNGDEAKFDERTGKDSWQNDAIRRWVGLWSGDSRDLEAVFGVPAPEPFVDFERAVMGADLYSTFNELRLDVDPMGLPPDDQNLFEKCVINDQLNYLGTALPEIFSGLICIGSLGNGDSYHLELAPDEGAPHTVLFFDHETHSYEWTFTEDLGALVYLAALTRAHSDELVSDAVAAQGFAALREKVAPSWHFSIEEHDDAFVPYEQEAGTSVPTFMFWRAYWIYYLFRQDGVVEVESLRNSFAENLNTVLAPEHLPARLETAARLAPTALYATWRAYLFDEPELEQYLEVCRAHKARIARDAAKLIDELRGGRKVLGRIEDWPKLLERFRALDLDPRRAAERAAEEEARQAAAAAERASITSQLAELDGEAELDVVKDAFKDPALNAALLNALLQKDARQEARRGVEFLLNGGYSRDNSLYRHEEAEACAHIAQHADAALALTCLGIALFGSELEEDEAGLARGHALDIACACAERVPEAGHIAVVDEIQKIDLDQRLGWEGKMLTRLVRELKVEAASAVFGALLEKIPDEGGFETAMAFDDFVGDVADALVALEHVEDATLAQLVRFAKGTELRLRKARVKSALCLARRAPERVDEELVRNLADFLTQINDPEENGWSLLAIAKSSYFLETIAEIEPMAHRYPQVKLAKALALRTKPLKRLAEKNALNGATDEALRACLLEPGYDQSADIKRRTFGLLAAEMFALEIPSEVVEAAGGLDPVVDKALGASTRWITWFDCERMSEDELIDVVRDPEIFGRAHAARALRGVERARGALEDAVRGLSDLERFRDRARYLNKEAVASLRALDESPSTTALFNEVLSSNSRDYKDPVLRDPPPWPALRSGMEHVANEKYGWQEKVALEWLSGR